MSRVQLALNVVRHRSSSRVLLQALRDRPAKRQPGYANFAIVDPPLKLVLIEDMRRTEAAGSTAR